jgi:hypothetical protein
MRRLAVRRTATAGALGAIITVVALMAFPSVGIGDPTTSHGGSPSDVYMQTEPAPEPCAEVPADGTTAMPQDIQLAVPSHVLAYFTFEWSGLDAHEFGLLNLVLDGSGPGPNYEFTPANPRINPNGTVMWSFPNVPPGTHTVAVYAAVDDLDPIPGGSGQDSGLFAALENCALTVFVIPVE